MEIDKYFDKEAVEQYQEKCLMELKSKQVMETNHKEFKPFDKVLVRDHENVWQPNLYGFWDKCRNNHTTMTDAYVSDDDILPYEGNEHLVGTTDEPAKEVKLEEGEFIFVFESMILFFDGICSVRRFIKIIKDAFATNGHNWTYAIRFSNFNPDDMEETAKHILCVKNGKVVKYKG